MLTVFISIWSGFYLSILWLRYIKLTMLKNEQNESFQDFFKRTVKSDPDFVLAKQNILNYSQIVGRHKRKPYSESPNYDKKPSYFVTTNEGSEKINPPYDWSDKIETLDLSDFKKELVFIDVNKQATNEGIQNQNFAEIVYMLEEYISMLHNYPDQIHSVADIQRKAILDKFIFLKK